MLIFVLLLAIIILISCLAFIAGLFMLIFNKEKKEHAIKMITYSLIVAIIGFGSCSALLNWGGFQL